jgi:hypothetical protein
MKSGRTSAIGRVGLGAMLLSVCAGIGAAQEASTATNKVTLRYRFTPGQIVRYEVTHEGEITTQVAEVAETTRNKSHSRKHFRVAGVSPEGAGDLELIIDWVRLEASFGDNPPTVFQSDDPEKQPRAYDTVLQAIGKPQAVLRLSPVGKVLDLTRKQGPSASTPTKPAAGAASAPESYLVPLPEEGVAVGESWKERFELEVITQDKLPLKVAMQRSYKLASLDKNQATIDFRTTILTPIEDPALAAQLIQRETSGKIVFDVEKGLVLSRTSAVDRTVVNPFGSKSSMRAASKYTERWIPEGSLAAGEGGTVKK